MESAQGRSLLPDSLFPEIKTYADAFGPGADTPGSTLFRKLMQWLIGKPWSAVKTLNFDDASIALVDQFTGPFTPGTKRRAVLDSEGVVIVARDALKLSVAPAKAGSAAEEAPAPSTDEPSCWRMPMPSCPSPAFSCDGYF